MSEQADAHASEAPEYAAGAEAPAKRRRELRQTRRRVEILEAAAEEFAIRGYHDASLQRIGDKVGLSKASLYYYVSSKSDLLAELEANLPNGYGSSCTHTSVVSARP